MAVEGVRGRRLGRTVRRALDPGDPYGTAHLRVVTRAGRVRLVVGLVVAAVIVVVPGIAWKPRLAVAALIAGYVLLAAAVDALGERWMRSSRMANLVLGLVAVFLAALWVPQFREAALLAYLLAVTVDTCIAGWRGGLEASLLAMALVVAGQVLVPSDERFEALTIALFACFLVAVVTVVNSLTEERRKAARDLERLQDGLRALTAAPELTPTLASTAEHAAATSEAVFVAVVLEEDGALMVAGAAPGGVHTAARRIFEGPLEGVGGILGPARLAFASRESVLLGDVDAAGRLAGWCAAHRDVLRELGVRSIAAVPLQAGGQTIGALVSAFDTTSGVHPDDLGLLEAYADQAALVIVRAQAYEHERLAGVRLQEADRLKSEFLATVSHELKTPLTAMKGFVDTVLLHWNRLSDVQRREMLGGASRNADALAQQIDQLLDLSRLDAGRFEMIFEDTPVLDLVRDVVGRMAPLLTDRIVVIGVPPALTARVDRQATAHVVANLLSNAVKFSDHGSTIEIGADAAGGEVRVWVRDEGIGIDPAEHGRIFERFYGLGEPGRARGTGIGLSIAARYVELQGGVVTLESRPGEGATFRFTVPAGMPASAGAPHAQPVGGAPAGGQPE